MVTGPRGRLLVASVVLAVLCVAWAGTSAFAQQATANAAATFSIKGAVRKPGTYPWTADVTVQKAWAA
jgi:hypothetical protein